MLKIAVDFDGTIVQHQYPEIGREIPFAIATLKKLQNEFSAILILWSVREGRLLNDAVEFCRSRGLEFYAVNSDYPDDMEVSEDEPRARKLNVDLFIDDRNIGGMLDWGVIYQMIKSGKYLEPPVFSDYDTKYAKKKKKGMLDKIFGK